MKLTTQNILTVLASAVRDGNIKTATMVVDVHDQNERLKEAKQHVDAEFSVLAERCGYVSNRSPRNPR